MIVAALIFSVLVLVWVCRADARARTDLAQPAALDPGMVARSLREDALQARIAGLTRENEQLAARRRDILHLACVAQGVTVGEKLRDTELLQAVRAAALLHKRGQQRMRREIAVRDAALAEIGSMVLQEPVNPGQYAPDELVQLARARQRFRGRA